MIYGFDVAEAAAIINVALIIGMDLMFGTTEDTDISKSNSPTRYWFPWSLLEF